VRILDRPPSNVQIDIRIGGAVVALRQPRPNLKQQSVGIRPVLEMVAVRLTSFEASAIPGA